MATASGLVLFKDYLRVSVKGKVAAPPVAIKADDLDTNFRKVSMVDPNKQNPLFAITQAGTVPKAMEVYICMNGVPTKIRIIGTVVQ